MIIKLFTLVPWNLKVHYRKHTGDMLQCQHCDYTTAYSNNMKSHSRKHTGEMLQCQNCDFITAYSNNMKSHSRKHTAEWKPSKRETCSCILCDHIRNTHYVITTLFADCFWRIFDCFQFSALQDIFSTLVVRDSKLFDPHPQNYYTACVVVQYLLSERLRLSA